MGKTPESQRELPVIVVHFNVPFLENDRLCIKSISKFELKFTYGILHPINDTYGTFYISWSLNKLQRINFMQTMSIISII